MADRVVRWVCFGLLLGPAPIGLAYGARWYYAERPPTMPEMLGAGDALLVVVAWCANALLVASVSIALLLAAAVAYGCRTADLATGRVQTAGQARILAMGSLAGLAAAAAVSVGAAAMSGPGVKEER